MLFRKIGEFAIHLDAAVPVPLPDGGELRPARSRLGPEQFRIRQRIEGAPGKRSFRQAAIGAVHIEPDRPELVVLALAQFEFRHPIENFTRIEIAENAALELEQKRRMKRVGQVQKNVRRSEPAAQLPLRQADAAKCRQIVCIAGRILVKQAIASSEPVGAELPLEVRDASRVVGAVLRRGQKLQPDRILFQSPQAEHPLQRDGEIAPAFTIFCGKSAAEENRHAKKKEGKTSNVQPRKLSSLNVSRLFPARS